MLNPTVLITGANGFVGTHMRQLLHEHGVPVIGLGRRSSASAFDSPSRYLTCDLTDYPAVEQSLNECAIDLVIHLAGESVVADAHRHPRTALMSNVAGTWNLLEALRRTQEHRLQRVLIVGSAQEYGVSGAHCLDEATLPLPITAYGFCKHLQTSVAHMYAATFAMPIVVARAFNLVGPHGSKGVCADLARHVINIEAGLSEPCLRLHDAQVERDFLDVRDAVAAFWSLLQSPRVQCGEVYNVCSGHAVAIATLAALFQHLSHRPFAITPVSAPDHAGGLRLCGNNRKLYTATDWHPVITLEQTITDVLATARVRWQHDEDARGGNSR